MLIDIEPLIPLLDLARQAQHDLQVSDAEWDALKKSEQFAQVDAFVERDAVSRKAYEDACHRVMEALNEAVINYGN